MLLRSYFKRMIAERELGTYVDVGCYHPIGASNTYLFYCLGWRGIGIDANANQTEKWAIYRPDDVVITAAIGEKEGSALLYRNTQNTGMSEIALSISPHGPDFDPPVQVPMRRLDSVLSENLDGLPIQFMSIDVEGSELGVLRSNDWQRFRPEVILLELVHLNLSEPKSEPSVAFLIEKGYALDGKIGSSGLFISNRN